jgi:hypothetical protein
MRIFVHWDLFNWIVCIQPIGEVAMAINGLNELPLVTFIALTVNLTCLPTRQPFLQIPAIKARRGQWH